jgi:ATP-dependent Clp protease ATP-binding subunit ClpB
VQDPLAEAILAGEIRDGATIKIGASQGKLTIDGRPVGGQDAEPTQAKSPTVVHFPKGA